MDPFIDIRDYRYELPPGRIALYPLPERDQSKLLVYKTGGITHSPFFRLEEFLPENSILFFNDTKVIPARLIFQKDTGAEIEIFLLNPLHPSSLMQAAMLATGMVRWQCAIGNLKRWRNGVLLTKKNHWGSLVAKLIDREESIVELVWSPSTLSFADVIGLSGVTPLPPYLKRKSEPADRERYQTVYSNAAGAVAAPTAGLHFTEPILRQIREKGILVDFLTLHVSAGTFQPVKEQNAASHEMHAEQVIVSRRNIELLRIPGKKILAAGTTSLRTLESLYWYGVKLLTHPDAEFNIAQNDPYRQPGNAVTRDESFRAIADMMQRRNLTFITGETSIYILPGYEFRVCDGLITNFHQPGSTLLLLVAAFVGEDWKKIYRQALENDYRFLSYGDSSLLLRN
jgi:S-adenosylmethionine:tRNA ribosyltransferase-isomerase